MDKDLLTFLLEGGHLNMLERVDKKAWPHAPLKYEAVLEHLAALIENRIWFPADLTSEREGVIIQNTGNDFIAHCLGYGAGGSRQPDRDERKTFKKSKDAADFYLRNDLRLPGDLDGWVVE